MTVTLKRRDFQTILNLAREGKVSQDRQLLFYKKAPASMHQALLNFCAPNQEIEKFLIEKGTPETLHLLSVRYGFYPSVLEWMMRECDNETVTKVVNCLHDKPSSVKVEHLMVRRCNKELLKLWLSKFYVLEDSTEKLLNEELDLSSMLSYYIELQECY